MLRADIAFVGTNGLTVEHGLTTPDADEAATKRAMVLGARRVVVLADSSSSASRPRTASPTLGEFHMLVTDDGVEDDDRSRSKPWEWRR